MVAEGDIVTGEAVQRGCHGKGLALGVGEISQGRPLNGISSVNDQGILILREGHGKQPHWAGLLGTEIRRIKISVGV